MSDPVTRLNGLIPFLSLALVAGCSSAPSANTVSDDIGSDRVVEMIVRNEVHGPVAVWAWWENGTRVVLGEVGMSATHTFTTRIRDQAVGLSVDILSDRLGGREAPEDFVLVRPGERLEWIVHPFGTVHYIGLLPK